mmetsp:Transcript_39186/g.92242  ORF Transcript_39186/g.92242 Transcript_39186/m.92242 type:complete len:446 (-) Transcript_39186:974-2311(-)
METPQDGKKRSALQAAWESDAKAVKKPRVRGDASLEAQVAQCIKYRKMSSWSHWSMDVKTEEGLTCRQWIYKKKKEANEGKKISHLFWRWLVGKFGPENEEDIVKLDTDLASMPQPLFKHYIDMLRSDPNRENMAAWAAGADECTSEKECIIVCQALRLLSPGGQGDQYSTGLQLMRLLQRSSMERRWPAVHSAMLKKFDDFVCQTWYFYSESSTDPAAFIEEHSDFIYLVFNKHASAAVLSTSDDVVLSSVKAEIRQLFSGSRAVGLVFSCAAKALAREDMVEMVNTKLAELEELTKVTPAKVAETMKYFTEQLPEIDGVDLLFKGRQNVAVSYSGVDIVMVARTPVKYAEMRLQAALRNAAATAGLLTRLPGELALVSAEDGLKMQVSSEVVAKANRARKHLHDALKEQDKGEDCIGGDLLKATLRLHGKKLHGIDGGGCRGH